RDVRAAICKNNRRSSSRGRRQRAGDLTKLTCAAPLGKKSEDAVLVRFANPALGNQAGDESPGGNVETVVRRGTPRWSHKDFRAHSVAPPVCILHLLRTTLLDRYLRQPIPHPPIKGRRGESHVKWYFAILGCQSLEIGADLVGDVSREGGA